MVRRAVLLASSEQYIRLAISFILVASISRLLTPAEVGVSVIGIAIVGIAMGLREFASSEYLIQRHDVSRDDVRTVFTVLFFLTTAIAIAIYFLAPYFAGFYDEPRLTLFLRIVALGGILEFIAGPTIALLRREMQFGMLALINISSVVVNAIVAVGLAVAGFSYMSIAWAALAGSGTILMLSFLIRPQFWMLAPKLNAWRGVLHFGWYAGLTFVVNKAYESLPQLVLGQVLHTAAVGIYSRASLVSSIPDRIVLTGVGQVAFPAFATHVREGRNLKDAYLHALSLISVLYWPALLLLALMAYPVVMLLLGDQWVSVVPLLAIMAVAATAWFPMILTTPVLLAVGANRERLLADLVGRSTAAVLLCSAAFYGVMAMALTQFVSLPFQMMVTLYFVRRNIPFAWREAGAAVYKSAIVAATTLIGPIAVVAIGGFDLKLSFGEAAVAGCLALPCWLLGVVATRHPVRAELEMILDAIGRSTFGRRWSGPFQRVLN